MKKNSSILKIIVPLILIFFSSYLLFKNISRQDNIQNNLKEHASQNPTQLATNSDNDQEFILASYPIEKVPLYKKTKISSMKYFVNDDSSSTYLYGGPVNYYNVVFETKANRNEAFHYYQSLMDQTYPEEGSDSQLVGKIDQYKLYLSQHQPDADTIYMQVALPLDEFDKTNPFYTDYPAVVKLDESWMEKESNYGLLNQNGGEAEYAQYFIIDQDKLSTEAAEDPYTYFYNQYREKYANMQAFASVDDDSMLSWQDGNNRITLNFSEDHGRVYLMIRQPMTFAK